MCTSDEILTQLEALYPDAVPALKFRSPYELLVAVILSAQCTDERVNQVTEKLFQEHNTPQKMLLLSQEELEKYIYSCGFYHNKAAHILSASRDILEKFGGEVPSTLDTHVFRVSNRLGLAEGSTPEKVEEGLCRVIPKEKWSRAHHWLIYHGRRVCHSQRPDCEHCTLAHLCKFFHQA